MPTKIEWCKSEDGSKGETWNPVTGCTKISTGCKNCYAERMSKRLSGRFGYPADEPFRVTLHPDKLDKPLHWRKPRRVFVCSMGDLFHEDVPDTWRDRVWRVMDNLAQHTFLILTKRPERLAEFWKRRQARSRADGVPFSNVWLGVTAENQEQADKRIPIMLQIPAIVRFVSVEPMLGPIDFNAIPGAWAVQQEYGSTLDWVICGSETGPGARPMDLDWARALHDQCQAASTPFFFKRGNDGSRLLDGRLWEEYPDGGRYEDVRNRSAVS